MFVNFLEVVIPVDVVHWSGQVFGNIWTSRNFPIGITSKMLSELHKT